MEILVQKVRVAFAKGIFEKTAFGGDAKAKADFNSKFILAPDHAQIAQLKKLEEDVAKEKWGAKADNELKVIRSKDVGLLHDGNTQRSDGFADMLFISARADQRPSTFNRDRSQITAEDGIIYSGCYVNLKIDVWAQDNQYGKRINATLLGVQFVSDGDSFAAGAPPATADDFADLGVDETEGDDPLFA